MSFKRSFITDHSLVKDYNRNVYQKNDLATNTTCWKFLKLETLKIFNFLSKVNFKNIDIFSNIKITQI